MRFKRTELSPANKIQYLLALGRKDIEILLAETENARKHTPRTKDSEPIVQRLRTIEKGLREALSVAEADGDEGYGRVPESERQNFDKARSFDWTDRINRLEIIDHRPCETCKGKGVVESEMKTCIDCVAGVPGRTVLVAGPAYGKQDGNKIGLNLQDDNRTLKIFVSKKDD